MESSLRIDIDSKKDGKVIYWVYVLYGFSSLAAFNVVLSTLAFFVKKMPGYSPDFFVGFFWSVLMVFSSLLVVIYGYKLTWGFKNNVVILWLVPICLCLPIFSEYMPSSASKFGAYSVLLITISVSNSLQICSIYA